eukprot:TRINITY_DN2013_c0_g1_i2.p1 TRINITY_DN2013_c0_g1~~TRINITY_DN2013_c0_g1_i2.p1  ORF type:complete len:1369 (-),score=377.94 TRINITY_DN2013_c0_g1_i2:22-3597(-)
MARNSLVLKRFVRKYHAEVELERLRIAYEEKLRCTTVVQRYVRQHHAKLEWLQRKTENDAATDMARFIKRSYAMGELERLREERRRRVEATTMLAVFVRRYHAQCELLTLEEAERIRREIAERERQEAERRKREEEERIRREAEEAERKRIAEEEARKAAEEAERKRIEAEKEAERKRIEAEKEAERRRIEAEKAAAEAAAALEAAKKAAKNEEERQRVIREAEEAARAAAEEARLLELKIKEEEERQQREAREAIEREEAAKRAKEEAERKVREEEERKVREEERKVREEEERKREEERAKRQQAQKGESTEEASSPATRGRGGGAMRGRGGGGRGAAGAAAPAAAHSPPAASAEEPKRGGGATRGRGGRGGAASPAQTQSSSSSQEQAPTPQVSAPQVSAPQASVPQVLAPQASAPRVSAPQASAPQASAPQVSTPQAAKPVSPVSTRASRRERAEASDAPVRTSRAARAEARQAAASEPRARAPSVTTSTPTVPAITKIRTAAVPLTRQRAVSVSQSGLAVVSNISDVMVEMEPEKYAELEAFLLGLGLPLVEQFSQEMIDLDQMLDWEDPRAELIDLGITQRGVIARICKALEAKKEPAPSIFASVFGGNNNNSVTAAPVAARQPAGPTPIQELPGLPLTLGLLHGVFFCDQARSKLSLLAATYSMYIRCDVRKGEQKRFKSKAPLVTMNNVVPLRPDWRQERIPTLPVKIEDGWELCIEYLEPGTFSDTILGSSSLSYAKMVRLGNGEHWVPVKYEDGTNIGQMLISISEMEDFEIPQEEWEEDEVLGDPFETRITELVRDYDNALPIARLVRCLAPRETTCAVLYIPTISDYFWQDEIATTFNEEGYNFYALEPRRYSRNIKPGTPQPRPYLVRDFAEYYEEIHWALRVLKTEEGMDRIILAGHGSGATVATLFAQDHPGEVSALFLNSPLVGLSPEIPGLSKPLGWFSPPDSQTTPVFETFHASVSVDRNGSFDWDQNLKPIPGYPIYCGWIDAMTKATERMTGEKGALNLEELPVLIMTSASHMPLTNPNHVLARKCDVIQDVSLIVRVAGKWGKKIQLSLIKDGLHDLFLSDLRIRDEAFDTFFDYFDWLMHGEEPPAAGGMKGQLVGLSAVTDLEEEGILDQVTGFVEAVETAVEEAKGTVSGAAAGALLNLEHEITTFVGSDDEDYNYSNNSLGTGEERF